MKYYRSTATGKILTDASLRIVNDVFGEDTVTNMISDDLLEIVENPSVVDCINSGNMLSAFSRYCEIHNCTMEEAKKAVYTVRADIFRIKNIQSRKQKKTKVETETEVTDAK